MTAVLCKCGRAHGILEFKILKLKMHYAEKPNRKSLVSPLTTLKNGRMVVSCCTEPLCDMLGNPILSNAVDRIQFKSIIDEDEIGEA
jgi:hypothetical protein